MQGRGGALLAARGKLPSYMILLVCTFAVIALIGFQTLKECRTVAAMLLAKENEIERLNNQHEKDAADLKKMSSMLAEKDQIRQDLESKLEDAEASLAHSRKQLNVCQQGRQKCVDREVQLDVKDDEMLSLQQMLREKDSEISAIKMQLAAQDMNKETAAESNPELQQTEKTTDNPEDNPEGRWSDDLVEKTDGEHEEEEQTMTGEADEKDADKGTEESSEAAAATFETEEHKSESLQELEEQSVDNEETVEDWRDVQKNNIGNSEDQTEAEDGKNDTDSDNSKSKPAETNGIEEKAEVEDAEEREDDGDMKSETEVG